MGRATLVLCASMLFAVGGLSAQEPVAKLMIGYGLEDTYRLGVGGSVGARFAASSRFPLSISARLLYHQGEDLPLPEPVIGFEGMTGDITQLQFGGDLEVSVMEYPFTLRGLVGAGVSRVSATSIFAQGSVAVDQSNFMWSPGVMVGLPTGDSYVALEARWIQVGDLENSLVLFATFGTSLLR